MEGILIGSDNEDDWEYCDNNYVVNVIVDSRITLELFRSTDPTNQRRRLIISEYPISRTRHSDISRFTSLLFSGHCVLWIYPLSTDLSKAIIQGHNFWCNQYSRNRSRAPGAGEPIATTKICPEPSCNCPPTSALPEGLPIDHEQALNGMMVAYAQQLLICTGQPDWTSRIENDGENKGWGNLVRGLKSLLGRGGPYLDVSGSYSPIMNARTLADTSSPHSSLSIMSWLRIRLLRQLQAPLPPLPRHSSSPASNTSPP